jgi:hypothetical protein
MSDKDLIKLPARKKLPAHLAKMQGMQDDGWESGTTGGFPVLSIKGKVFHVRRNGELELVTRPDDPDEPASSLNIVILKANEGVSKTFYEKDYEDGDDTQPDCASANGVVPLEDAPNRQAKKCALCPMNEWGSRISESGAKGKRCSDNKRLSVAAAGQLNDPMLLRVPPTSLKNWDNYTRMLAKRGLNPTMVVTKIRFDTDAPHQVLKFEAVDYVDEESFEELEEILKDPVLLQMVNSSVIPTVDRTGEPEEEDDEEPAPKPKPKAKRKAKPKPEPEPEPEEEDEEDEEGDDLDELDIDDLDFGDDD